MKILIVEDEPSVATFLSETMHMLAYEHETAPDGAAGLEKFQSFRPDLVLADISMPKMDGLALLDEIRKRDPAALVVMMTGFGSEEYAVKALRLGANNYLQKPVRHADLLPLLSKYRWMIEARSVEMETQGMIEARSLVMRLDNRVALVPRIVERLIQETGPLLGPRQRLGARLGLIELLVNAIEHGNLGISWEEKSAALADPVLGLHDLYEKRLADPKLADRTVLVEYAQNARRCQWTITDEGAGFDWSKYPLEDPPGAPPGNHGGGIFLSRIQFDELEYLGVGNGVRAAIHVKRAAPADTPSADAASGK